MNQTTQKTNTPASTSTDAPRATGAMLEGQRAHWQGRAQQARQRQEWQDLARCLRLLVMYQQALLELHARQLAALEAAGFVDLDLELSWELTPTGRAIVGSRS